MEHNGTYRETGLDVNNTKSLRVFFQQLNRRQRSDRNRTQLLSKATPSTADSLEAIYLLTYRQWMW